MSKKISHDADDATDARDAGFHAPTGTTLISHITRSYGSGSTITDRCLGMS